MSFVWNGRKMDKYTEIIDTCLSLPKEEQEKFVSEYAKTGPHALSNIGYFSGYYSSEMADKIMEVFKTEHPIFGKSHPSPQQAYEAGLQLASSISNDKRVN